MPKSHHIGSPETMEEESSENEAESKAARLKTLAEDKYNSSDLKSALKYAKKSLRLCPDLDGTAEMVTAFRILRAASKSTTDSPDWYKILQIEPFSHINTIKKQYKKLALTLHPDKNPFAASEEAFKLVGEAFRVLSDKIRRQEYEMKLRIAMQSAAEVNIAVSSVDTFWTVCSTCRLMHQFESKYLGHNLMCPNCKKSFEAVEVSDNNNVSNGGVGERMRTRSATTGVRISFSNGEVKRKTTSVGELLKRPESKRVERSGVRKDIGDFNSKRLNENGNLGDVGASVTEGLRSKRVRKPRNLDYEGGSSIAVVESERSKANRAKSGDEMMTLAEMQMLAKRKKSKSLKLKDKEKENGKEMKATSGLSSDGNLETGKRSLSKKAKSTCTSRLPSGGNLETGKKSSSKYVNSSKTSQSGNLEVMAVEDSDFYEFDKDRVERSFRKGQVWAIYDDDDGMPRHYGLIDDVVSVHPFEVKLSWLDLQNDVDEVVISWEKMGFQICCGRFKVSKTTLVNPLNIFSHIVDCDRVAKELYRIYPKKGSVWALYNENAIDANGRSMAGKDKWCYDIVTFLTSYSEVYGLSMAYLEKVNGFKTVFKRKDIGSHAIKWLKKDDIQLFSHQIPARKLSGEEASGLAKDCWELDPASLPPDLLTIGWVK